MKLNLAALGHMVGFLINCTNLNIHYSVLWRVELKERESSSDSFLLSMFIALKNTQRGHDKPCF